MATNIMVNDNGSARHLSVHGESFRGGLRRVSSSIDVGASPDAKEGHGFKKGDRVRYWDTSRWITGKIQGIPMVDGHAQPFVRIRGKLYSVRIVEKI